MSAPLAETAKRLLLLLILLGALCSPVAASSSGPSHVTPVKVRRELRQILSAPEYNQHVGESWLDKWLKRAWSSVVKAIKKLLERLFAHVSLEPGSNVGWIAKVGSWVVLIAFIGLLGLVIYRLTKGRGARTKKDSQIEDIYEIPTAKPMLRRAAKFAEAGDYKAAFKAAYIASIAYLDEVRALRFEKSRTNWEYMRELKQGGHERPLSEMQPLTQEFDRKVYGREVCGKDDYLRAAEVYERLSGEEAK